MSRQILIELVYTDSKRRDYCYRVPRQIHDDNRKRRVICNAGKVFPIYKAGSRNLVFVDTNTKILTGGKY